MEQALELAEQALENGAFTEALALSDTALGYAPSHPQALEVRGVALAELNELEAADEAFATLLRFHPDSIAATIAAADVKIRQSADDPQRIHSGLALLSKAEPRARADETLSQELDLLRGIAFNQLGDFPEALRALARVLRIDPEHGEAQLERGLALFEQGTFGEAGRAFEHLAHEFPQEPWSFHYLGLLAERRGENPEPWFVKARALDPEEFPAPTRLSTAQFDAAVADAIDKLPDHAKPHLSNAIISVEPLPTDSDVAEGLSPTLLGVFRGTPIDERLHTEAGHHQTVRITLFQKNLERFARSVGDLQEEIRITVLHEVGHLLGLDEDELYDGLD